MASNTSQATSNASSGWIPQLDGLRGISILMVLVAHVYAPGWHGLQTQGGYGVIVFFVLSGFLITQLLLREERDTGRISLLSFYVRRAFRLFPIYYLVLGVYCVLIFVFGLRPDGRAGFADALPWYLTYMQEVPWFRDRTHLAGLIQFPFYQSWSLGIEEKFYLLWPVVAFRVSKADKARIVIATGAVLVFSAARFVPLGRYIYPYAAISWGCLFALLYDTAGIQKRVNGWVSSWRAPLVLFTWPLLHAVSAWNPPPGAARLIADLVYPISICFVILASLRSVWLARVLSFTPLAVLGRYSYSMYLIHLLVRQAVERVLHKIGIGGNGSLIFLLMLLFSTAGAAVLYNTVESRFRDMGRRIARSWCRKADKSKEADPPAPGGFEPGVDCVTPG